MLRFITLAACFFFLLSSPLLAQVDYNSDGTPWTHKANSGPDAVTGGWYYNMGITGIRAMLMTNEPTHLLVKYVFSGSPASGKIYANDVILGANGVRFNTAHKDGYGMDVFGGDGPIKDFGIQLDRSQGSLGGKISILLRRSGREITVDVFVGTSYGAYASGFPFNCSKSDKIFNELCAFLASQQRTDGTWGWESSNLFAPLALLASGNSAYNTHVEKAARAYANRTKSVDSMTGLTNWRYVCGGIFLSEYYLAKKEDWVLPELREIRDFLLSSQYMDASQFYTDRHNNVEHGIGGWGHNPGYEGYGPIAMITGKATLALCLMKKCGIYVRDSNLLAAFENLKKSTGPTGYVWYGDSNYPTNTNWADMGRTGISALAFQHSPFTNYNYKDHALRNARMIGDHPEPFPDTHASPVMGLGTTGLGAFLDGTSFRKLMDENRWWFTLAQCYDKSFYYQPNRDNYPGMYQSSSRVAASAPVALILAAKKRNLQITGGSGTTITASVSSFTLMNSATSRDIGTLTDGYTINLSQTGKALNIRANVSGTPGQVNFTLTGPVNRNHTESAAPYCLFGDVYSWNPPLGNYTLTANCDGSGAKTVRFSVISGVTTLPSVTISASDASASESGPNTGTFRITRSGSTTSSLTVYYAISGTATRSSDYNYIGTSTTLAAGSASGTITITPIDDSVVEGSETVILRINSNAAYSVGSPSSATVNIADNDATVATRVTGFTLVNAATNRDISALNNDATVNLGQTGKSLSIRANTVGTPGKVHFTLTGAMSHTQTESYAPYALFGDSGGDYISWTPRVGSYTLTANCDGSGALTIRFSVTEGTIPPPPPTTKLAINCGGPAFYAADGTYYQADRYFTTSYTYQTGDAIASTGDDTLYRTERYGRTFGYNIPLADGTYTVTLKMAEIYWYASGKRIFTVRAEGLTLFSNFDIHATAGHDNAFDRTFTVKVTGGNLDLDFSTATDNAKISAILIQKQ